MRLTAVRIRNFRSFRDGREFIFPEGPGLYFLRGENRAQPRLGGNAVGKTTLWEAICWAIYGKTSRGLKAGDICNWGAGKSTCVELDWINDDGTDGRLIRTWGPISWTLNGEDLTKDASSPLASQLRLSFAPFLHSILMSQNQPMFLDLKAEAKAAVFSEVMNLDGWLGYSSRASDLAREADTECRFWERKVASLQGELQAAAKSEDFEDRSAAWQADHKRDLEEILRRYSDLIARLEPAKAKVVEAELAESRKRELYAEKLNQVEEYSAARSRFRAATDDAKERMSKARADLERRASHKVRLEMNQPCGECGHVYLSEELASRQREARTQWSIAMEESQTAYAKLKKAEREESIMERSIDESRERMKQAMDAHHLATLDLKDARRALLDLEKRLDAMEDEAEKVEKDRNPYEALSQEATERRAEIAAELTAAERKRQDYYERWMRYSFWVRGFKEVRLQRISEALTQLEVEVNNCVVELGLVGWELLFAVDKESKSGSMQRGFTVHVLSPDNKKPVPWEAWSGGESQRLRLAGNAGLSNLIRSTTGTPLDLEVWDEPTNGMSPEGIDDLLECLAARAKREARQIWVVDHRALGSGVFDGNYRVIKDKNGSRFE